MHRGICEGLLSCDHAVGPSQTRSRRISRVGFGLTAATNRVAEGKSQSRFIAPALGELFRLLLLQKPDNTNVAAASDANVLLPGLEHERCSGDGHPSGRGGPTARLCGQAEASVSCKDVCPVNQHVDFARMSVPVPKTKVAKPCFESIFRRSCDCCESAKRNSSIDHNEADRRGCLSNRPNQMPDSVQGCCVWSSFRVPGDRLLPYTS